MQGVLILKRVYIRKDKKGIVYAKIKEKYCHLFQKCNWVNIWLHKAGRLSIFSLQFFTHYQACLLKGVICVQNSTAGWNTVQSFFKVEQFQLYTYLHQSNAVNCVKTLRGQMFTLR